MFLSLNNKHKIIIVISVIIILTFTKYNSYLTERKTVYILSEESQSQDILERDNLSNIKEVNKNVIVHIEGEVTNPGIYTLSGEARVFDAVEAAGGLKESANRKRVNLAKKISDEEFVYIPSIEEAFEDIPFTVEVNSNSQGFININKASASDLESLPGIGSTIADRIIDYRNQNGPFKSIEEIQKVSGIGEKKFQEIREKITIN